MIWLSLALTYAGLAVFALGMEAHHRAVFARAPGARLRSGARMAGGVLLVLALVASVVAVGAGLGAVEWMIGLSASGFALTLVLAFRPRWWAWPVPILLTVAGWAA